MNSHNCINYCNKIYLNAKYFSRKVYIPYWKFKKLKLLRWNHFELHFFLIPMSVLIARCRFNDTYPAQKNYSASIKFIRGNISFYKCPAPALKNARQVYGKGFAYMYNHTQSVRERCVVPSQQALHRSTELTFFIRARVWNRGPGTYASIKKSSLFTRYSRNLKMLYIYIYIYNARSLRVCVCVINYSGCWEF